MRLGLFSNPILKLLENLNQTFMKSLGYLISVDQKLTLNYYLESTFYEGLQFTPTPYFETLNQTGIRKHAVTIQLKSLLNNHLHITFMTQSCPFLSHHYLH